MMLGGLLPPIGLEIPISGYGVNIPLKVDVLGVIPLDFRGGIKMRVEANLASGLGGVKLKVIGLEFSADSPVLGKVTISQNDIDETPLSLLEVTKNMPPTFRQTMFLDLNLTIEKPPGGGPPLVLSNTKTATLLNDNLTVFPPQGAVYQLQQPVDFAPVGAPNQVVAQLLQFPVTLSHNP
ncbi:MULTISPECIES: hypothetical protein [unclassified Nostoc]|uniref:hypothetical protein n=1 Tax=unclassified Nostoc TaxID=2593658 RepID=UPI002AD4BF41|nr:hypothetical protein [Nostoc sp. DedQUE03]MDZ7976925.1 hypothetical protein [Nostoc sp. DedQUE03]MDZ8043328.1 hypothetical protein [Nostoc sp. DedQUE02]